MGRYIIAILKLIRLPNIFTAISNVWVGYAIGMLFTAWATTSIPLTTTRILNGILYDVSIVTLSSAMLYGGGAMLNDCFDMGFDCRTRPERVLPSRIIPPQIALGLGLVLLAFGSGLGFYINPSTGIITSAIALLALLYDITHKKFALLGVTSMAFCRGFNWMLGLSAGKGSPTGGSILWNNGVIIPPLIIFFYVAVLSAIARLETKNPSLRQIVKKGLLIIPLIDGFIILGCVYFAVGFVSLPVFLIAIAVWSLFIPAWFLSRYFKMT